MNAYFYNRSNFWGQTRRESAFLSDPGISLR